MTDDSGLRLYLVRAAWEWCSDNGLRTLLVARADGLPDALQKHASAGQISLDISRSAVQNLQFGESSVRFTASFSGVAHSIEVDVDDILWIGSPVRGIGIGFELPESDGPPTARIRKSSANRAPAGGKRPHLKLV